MSKRKGIHRAAQRCFARVTCNAGNGGFIHGGKLARVPTPHRLARALLLAALLTPTPPTQGRDDEL